MSFEPRQQIQTALHLLMELPCKERAAYLASLRADQPWLAAAVEGLFLQETLSCQFSEGRPLSDPPQHLTSGNQWIVDILLDALEIRSQDATPLAQPTSLAHTILAERVFASPLQEGELGRLREFRILRVLGEGGMGIVYEIDDTRLHDRRALKVLKPHLARIPESRQRFLEEGRAMAVLKHPRIIDIYQADEEKDVPFFVMPLLTGETLKARLERDKPLPIAEVVQLGRQIAEGLAVAHAQGMIHRDIKPSNIWLKPGRDGSAEVIVLDFGLARIIQSKGEPLSVSGIPTGTPGYIAPEQVRGERVQPQADLFSLGCVLFEMSTGKRPFERNDFWTTLNAVLTDTPALAQEVNPAIPTALSRLIERLLAPHPDARLGSATEVIHALDLLDGSRFQSLPHPSPRQPVQVLGSETSLRNASRWSILLLASLLGGVIVLGGGMLLSDLGMSTLPKEGLLQPVRASVVPELGRPVPARLAPLEIHELDVHYYRWNGVDHTLVGRLGVVDGSFHPRLQDCLQLQSRLSRPAYCYVIAYYPNGQEELCFPSEPSTPPPLSETPWAPEEATLVYFLEEGTGLMAFVLVVSPEPLPAYATWKKGRGKSPWRASRTQPGVVWKGTPSFIRPCTQEDPESRGKGKLQNGLQPLHDLLDWLDREPRFEAIETVAFMVGQPQ